MIPRTGRPRREPCGTAVSVRFHFRGRLIPDSVWSGALQADDAEGARASLLADRSLCPISHVIGRSGDGVQLAPRHRRRGPHEET